MKKATRKLAIHGETLRMLQVLERRELERVAGGSQQTEVVALAIRDTNSGAGDGCVRAS